MTKGNCRSCGEDILWLKTAAGKNMPLNAWPEPGGTVKIVDGLAVQVPEHARHLEENYLLLYKCHFATCPRAAYHRKTS